MLASLSTMFGEHPVWVQIAWWVKLHVSSLINHLKLERYKEALLITNPFGIPLHW